MHLLNQIKNNKKDIFKFIVYTIFFSITFFVYNNAISPGAEVVFFSANKVEIKQDETKIEAKQEIVNTKKIDPSFSVLVKPDKYKINDLFSKIVTYNVKSETFYKKVTPLSLVIDRERDDPRGQVVGKKMILSGTMTDLREATKVFVHELGHIVDLYYLKEFSSYDPSENFYNINWLSYKVKKKDSKIDDFVSGYAISNKYEDFAESFTFYVFHNEEFAKRAKNNPKLQKKYNFFSKYIFINDEFKNTSFNTDEILSYNWDTTKIYINLKKYLYYIR